MRLFLKILKIVGILIVALLIIVSAAIYFSGPQLPEDIDKTIDDVQQSDLPEFLKGETGYVYSKNTKVWYESIEPNSPTKGTVLLFMGIANDALGWPQGFIDLLVESRYQVIRYDYRGTGMSDWVPGGAQSPYSLADLASVLPNCRTKWFENMGHDIPPSLYDSLIAELIENFERNPN
jgi:pimeloyl-ACP methyl ester carboxylesterase